MSLSKKVLFTFLLLIFFAVVGFVFEERPEQERDGQVHLISLAVPTNLLPARIKVEANIQTVSWIEGLPFSIGRKYNDYLFSRERKRIERMLTSRKILRNAFATLSERDLVLFAGWREPKAMTEERKERLFGVFCDSYWVRQSRNTALFELCFEHTNASIAADMANRICRQLTNQTAVKAEMIDLALPSMKQAAK